MSPLMHIVGYIIDSQDIPRHAKKNNSHHRRQGKRKKNGEK